MYHFFKALFVGVLTLGLTTFTAHAQTAPMPGADRIMFYNIENLFDTIDDPLTEDKEFLPTAASNWNSEKYTTKLKHIGEVVETAGFPFLVGMAEVENKGVLEDLVKQPVLAAKKYAFVHFESPDERGIDVALLYNSEKFKVQASKNLFIAFDKEPNERTRDILYVKGEYGGEVLHVFVNHWPSRREGTAETQPRRENAANRLRTEVDSIFKTDENAQIVIMGDFNDYPTDQSIKYWLKAQPSDAHVKDGNLYNLADRFAKEGKGTHKYKGEWGTLDQLFVSSAFLAKKGIYTKSDAAHIAEFDYLLEPDPKGGQWTKRTYAGNKYLGGYSDHLPVYLDVYKK